MSYQPSAISHQPFSPKWGFTPTPKTFGRGGLPRTTNPLVWGFTLVELILVMAIIAILTTFITGGLGSSQVKGRDAQRKSDLRQLAGALELYYQDYGEYPAENNGVIIACPYDSGTGTGTDCTWGSGRFTDDKTLYLKRIPADPDAGKSYRYRLVPGLNNQKFQLFARLENPNDKGCIDDGSGPNCTNPVVHLCGSTAICNFAVTSSNVDATE